MGNWNLWHGCHKISAGCMHCYMYRRDSRYGLDSSVVTKTSSFYLPMQRRRSGEYKLTPADNPIYTCFTSDFFVEEADAWRQEAWEMMYARYDLHFFLITKRIHRLEQCLPPNWGDGYDNVTIACTTENQDRVDYRLPIYLAAPIKHKYIICEPLLEEVHLEKYLTPAITQVVAGGESGPEARICNYDWILSLRRQCKEAGVSFMFKQTGANFVKDGKLYKIPRKLQHAQARKAGISFGIRHKKKPEFIESDLFIEIK